ncbi:MAG TPA: DUF2892 domain-containing protein [Anaerolineae bacterium]|nr:DUF2892 domain-containing protein [Anaerolineae bacterium]
MKSNESQVDRIIRVILGIVLIAVGFFFIKGTVGVIIGVIGLIPLITGLIGFCPLYALFKINTKGS